MLYYVIFLKEIQKQMSHSELVLSTLQDCARRIQADIARVQSEAIKADDDLDRFAASVREALEVHVSRCKASVAIKLAEHVQNLEKYAVTLDNAIKHWAKTPLTEESFAFLVQRLRAHQTCVLHSVSVSCEASAASISSALSDLEISPCLSELFSTARVNVREKRSQANSFMRCVYVLLFWNELSDTQFKFLKANLAQFQNSVNVWIQLYSHRDTPRALNTTHLDAWTKLVGQAGLHEDDKDDGFNFVAFKGLVPFEFTGLGQIVIEQGFITLQVNLIVDETGIRQLTS